MEITTDDLLRIIGRKQVEIEALQEMNRNLLQQLRRQEASVDEPAEDGGDD